MTQIDFWIGRMEVAKSAYEALPGLIPDPANSNTVTVFNVTMQR